MYKKSLSVVAGALIAAQVAVADPITLVNGSTLGRYNSGLGQLLDGTNPFGGSNMFPLQNSSSGDPVLNIPSTSDPDLSAASAQLGSWLTNPAAPGGTWSAGNVAIPSGWAVNTESAIIYTINSANGLTDVVASFGVDNGIFLWVDGQFQGGYLRPGGSSLGEHVFNIGSLSAGTHYIQVLREDHGGGTGYGVLIGGETVAVPEPTSMALMGFGLAGLVVAIRRRKQA